MTRVRFFGRILAATAVLLGAASMPAEARQDPPRISGLSPTSGGAGTNLVITGEDFDCTAWVFGSCWAHDAVPTVTVANIPCPVTGFTETRIECTAPVGAGQNQAVRVNRNGTLSNTVSFHYLAPQVTGMSTPSKPTAGGNVVTLSGNHFGPGGVNSSIQFGSGACSVQSWSNTLITCAPSAGIGTHDVRVSASGQLSNIVQYTYDPPQLTGVSPNSVPTAGGTSIVLQGANFGNSAVSVTVGSSACAVQSRSHTAITCVAPAGLTTVKVTVAGTASNTLSFAYDLPQVTGISSGSKPTAGGNTITVTGSSFGTLVSGNRVEIGSALCAVTSWTHGSISCVAPAGVGTQQLRVVANGHTSSTVNYQYSPPGIGSLLPSSGLVTGGTPLVIQGQNFGGGLGTVTAQVGSAPCVVVSVSHDTLTCTLPAGVAGPATVTVTLAGQQSNAAMFQYQNPVCQPGSFGTGATCTPCPLGMYSTTTNASACSPASPGFFVPSTGSTQQFACAANTFQPLAQQSSCEPCASGFESPAGATACTPIGGYPAAITIRAECVAPDPTDPAKWLVRFGYENRFENSGLPFDAPYGAANQFTVNGTDIGALAGVPTTLALGIHTNAFTFRFSDTETVVWSVVDPQSGDTHTASPTASTPSCVVQGPAGDAGPQGPAGPQGVPGPEGSVGPQGPAGIDGAPGALGPQGPAGLDGQPGPQGPEGFPGADGAAGPVGATGATGATGAIGPQGPSGADGAPGVTGPQGPAGADGAPGVIGPIGPAGADGAAGAVGPTGPAGADGAPGAVGPIGPAGANGAAGAVGPTGPAGANGAAGATGPQGPIGPAGLNGTNGAPGATGPQGLAGTNGAQGAAGATGPRGATGATGATGAAGPQGTPGNVPRGTLIFVFEGEPVPSGFTYVGSFRQSLNGDRRDNDFTNSRDNDRRGNGGRDDDRDNDRVVTIRIYRKN